MCEEPTDTSLLRIMDATSSDEVTYTDKDGARRTVKRPEIKAVQPPVDRQALVNGRPKSLNERLGLSPTEETDLTHGSELGDLGWQLNSRVQTDDGSTIEEYTHPDPNTGKTATKTVLPSGEVRIQYLQPEDSDNIK